MPQRPFLPTSWGDVEDRVKTRFLIDLARILLATASMLVIGPRPGHGADPSPGASVDRVENGGRGQFVVQIVGRFCEYQRRDVKAALQDLWSVRHIEFLNDHGTLRLFYESRGGTEAELASAVERALSLGWFCSAHVDPNATADAPVRLVEMLR